MRSLRSRQEDAACPLGEAPSGLIAGTEPSPLGRIGDSILPARLTLGFGRGLAGLAGWGGAVCPRARWWSVALGSLGGLMHRGTRSRRRSRGRRSVWLGLLASGSLVLGGHIAVRVTRRPALVGDRSLCAGRLGRDRRVG